MKRFYTLLILLVTFATSLMAADIARYGVNNEAVKAELNANGWFYDPRFEGIRSVKSDDTYVSSEITLSLPAYANTNTPVVFGMYSYFDSESAKKVYGYFKDSNDNILLKNRTLGYNITGNITTNNGNIRM